MKPVIKNEASNSNPLLGPQDGELDYVMLFVKHKPGESSPDHTHPWEHQAFITKGSGILVCDGNEYPIKRGDAILVPRNVRHQFKNTGNTPLERVTVNPTESL